MALASGMCTVTRYSSLYIHVVLALRSVSPISLTDWLIDWWWSLVYIYILHTRHRLQHDTGSAYAQISTAVTNYAATHRQDIQAYNKTRPSVTILCQLRRACQCHCRALKTRATTWASAHRVKWGQLKNGWKIKKRKRAKKSSFLRTLQGQEPELQNILRFIIRLSQVYRKIDLR